MEPSSRLNNRTRSNGNRRLPETTHTGGAEQTQPVPKSGCGEREYCPGHFAWPYNRWRHPPTRIPPLRRRPKSCPMTSANRRMTDLAERSSPKPPAPRIGGSERLLDRGGRFTEGNMSSESTLARAIRPLNSRGSAAPNSTKVPAPLLRRASLGAPAAAEDLRRRGSYRETRASSPCPRVSRSSPCVASG